jgi:RNA-splicing ligase RtcB
MSRSQARKRFSPADLESAMEGRTWLTKDAAALVDEIPGAYKDLAQAWPTRPTWSPSSTS